MARRSCHLVSHSRGRLQVTLLSLTTVLTCTFSTSAYTDTTPGIKWNVSDIPIFPPGRNANLYWFQLYDTSINQTTYPIPGPNVVNL